MPSKGSRLCATVPEWSTGFCGMIVMHWRTWLGFGLGLGLGLGFGFGFGFGLVLNEGRLQVGDPGGDGSDTARSGEAAVVASEAAAARDRGGGVGGEEGGLDRVVEPG